MYIPGIKSGVYGPESSIKSAIGYVRVSTDSQESNSSLDFQRSQITNWSEQHSIQLLNIFSDVESGNEDDRPGLKAALKAMRKVDAFVVCRVDRLARKTSKALDTLDRVLVAQKRLCVIELPMDLSSPVGRLVFTQLAAVAELERHMIAERTAAGRLAKEAKGGYAFGAPAYGWLARKGEMLIDPIEQEVISTVKKLRKLGWSLRDIAAKLTALRLPTKRGGDWHPSIISKILKRLGLG